MMAYSVLNAPSFDPNIMPQYAIKTKNNPLCFTHTKHYFHNKNDDDFYYRKNEEPFISTNPTVTVCYPNRKETPVTMSTCESSLPPLKFPSQKTVFLDLDKTLIHSVFAIPPSKYDFVVKCLVNGQRHDVYYVLKHPFLDEFLQFLSKRDFQIIIFTAGSEEYASPILDKLDSRGLIAHRLYRDSTKILNGKRVKDISGFGRDLKNVVIIDDKPRFLQPDNAIRIKPFIDNLEDVELLRLMKYFKSNRFLPKKKKKN